MLLHRPCDEKIMKGPCLMITMAREFRLALLDDMEQGSVGEFVHVAENLCFLI